MGKIQVNTMKGDSMGGMSDCPGNPVGYVGEGKVCPFPCCGGAQYDPATFPVTDAVRDAGVSAEEWAEICSALRKAKGATGIGGGFSKAIEVANGAYFKKCGLEATYAEYAAGQKCMIVYKIGEVPA
mmetsp:Transcript_4930/g.17227  ORF Transcript_4930/g.17227 Transcript_4930/m.17227 type:complete len:127 (-) Transcript_4930:82-462(-)